MVEATSAGIASFRDGNEALERFSASYMPEDDVADWIASCSDFEREGALINQRIADKDQAAQKAAKEVADAEAAAAEAARVAEEKAAVARAEAEKAAQEVASKEVEEVKEVAVADKTQEPA